MNSLKVPTTGALLLLPSLDAISLRCHGNGSGRLLASRQFQTITRSSQKIFKKKKTSKSKRKKC